jgi:hypothetical protein
MKVFGSGARESVVDAVRGATLRPVPRRRRVSHLAASTARESLFTVSFLND